MDGRPPADDGCDGDGESDRASGTDAGDGVELPVLERVAIESSAGDRPADGDAAEWTVRLPDDLAGDLDDFCRQRYLHREEAIRSLLADWLDGRSAE